MRSRIYNDRLIKHQGSTFEARRRTSQNDRNITMMIEYVCIISKTTDFSKSHTLSALYPTGNHGSYGSCHWSTCQAHQVFKYQKTVAILKKLNVENYENENSQAANASAGYTLRFDTIKTMRCNPSHSAWRDNSRLSYGRGNHTHSFSEPADRDQ